MNSHPIINIGTHIIIDIYNINNNEKLKYKESIIQILDDITNKFNLKVVNKAFHQFNPVGVTGVYILAESHLSIHTFVEENKVAMDLYTCKPLKNIDEIITYIQTIFGICNINYKIIQR